MNLQVNLLLESERRSGTFVRWKFMVLWGVIILFISLIIISVWVNILANNAKKHKESLEEHIKQIQPLKQNVAEMQRRLAKHKKVAELMAGWRNSRIDVYLFLDKFRLLVPANMQITYFMLTQKINTSKPAKISGSLKLEGKVIGKYAKNNVTELDRNLRESEPFLNYIEDVKVQSFEAAEEEMSDIRLFEIGGELKTRKLSH
jgi:cell division protein FtsI/penicillin-binding protein 2